MDTNLIFSIFIIIILTVVTIEWDEAFILLLIGFVSIALAINLDLAFEIDNTTYQGFGELIQLLYAFVAVFAFVRTFSDSLLARIKRHGH